MVSVPDNNDQLSTFLMRPDLTLDEKWVFNYLDSLYDLKQIKGDIKPSKILYGAKTVMIDQIRSINDDWMAQSANSVREVLYSGLGNKTKQIKKNLRAIVSLSVEEQEVESVLETLMTIYSIFTNIAHHNVGNRKNETAQMMQSLGVATPSDKMLTHKEYEDLWYRSIIIFRKLFQDSLHIHEKLDGYIKSGLANISPEQISVLLENSVDAKQYFFSVVPVSWAKWLWDNSFLESIHQNKYDSQSFALSNSELNFIEKVSKVEPDLASDMILSTTNSAEHFDPEIISWFIRMTPNLEGEGLQKVVQRSVNEDWVKLMGHFNHWGFDYKEILEKLLENKSYEEILDLAKTMVAISPKTNRYDNIFYFSPLRDTGVFEVLSQLPEEYDFKVLVFYARALSLIVKTNRKSERGVFDHDDASVLFDVDIFSLEGSELNEHARREDIKMFLLGSANLIEKMFSSPNSETELAYSTLYSHCTSASVFYKLKLFLYTRDPQFFLGQFSEEINKIFTASGTARGAYFYGAEYEHAVRIFFDTITDEKKQGYLDKIYESFDIEDKDERHRAWYILSALKDRLNEDQIKVAEEKLRHPLEDNYEPRASITDSSYGGFVEEVTPFEIGAMPIKELVSKLKTEYDPATYKPESTGSFYRDRNLNGLRNEIQKDLQVRTNEYITNINLFFDPKELHSHYTYSIIDGIRENLRDNSLCELDWNKVIDFLLIVSANTDTETDSKQGSYQDTGWISTWHGVDRSIADLALLILNRRKETDFDFDRNRDLLLQIFKNLLSKEAKTEIESDLFTEAINSMRGIAFQGLVTFLYHDYLSEKDGKEKETLPQDIKNLFEEIVETETQESVLFLMGHYISAIYFRDRDWVKSLLPKIFTLDNDIRFYATTEGYLSSNLYTQILEDIGFVYEALITRTKKDYPERKYHKEFDSSIATHFGLAYLYDDSTDLDSKLMNLFWENADVAKQGEFIEFIGRHFNSSDNDILEKEIVKTKLTELWKVLLSQELDPGVYSHFDHWFSDKINELELSNLSERILNTLQKSEGRLDWEYGLFKMFNQLVVESPKNTLEIIDLFVDAELEAKDHFWLQKELEKAIADLYEIEEVREDVVSLINKYLPRGRQEFWKLKSIIK